MTPDALMLLAAAAFLVAILYSSIGHGGASWYIASLALFSVTPTAFKPTALVLNILVAVIATYSVVRCADHRRLQAPVCVVLPKIPA